MAREYKDSGIEWIGQIPKEWKIVPFKAYFTTGKGLSFTKADLTPQGHAVVSYGQVHSKVNTGTRLDDTLLRYIPDSITENGDASRMNKGDFIFADTSEDLEGCGNCVYVDRNMELYAGYHSVTAKPKVQYDNKFLAYYFLTPCWRSQIRSRVTGIKVYSISQSIINKTYIFVPPLSIQQKIADYLDKICGEVDELVAIQETMIEELKAYKQSVITEAVTKGLNPNVPMRNSGIDWIGNIPKHWQMKRLKFMCEIQTGNQDTQDAEQDGEYPFYVRSPKVEHSNKYSFEGEGILMAGDGAGAGRVFHHAFGKYAVHQRVYRLSSFDDIDTTFLFHYISNLFCKVMDMGSAQSTVPSVRLPMLQNFVVCIPSIEEQQHIATYLDTQCSEIDALIALKQAKIEELKEYKKSVIYEYVTGKKEVV